MIGSRARAGWLFLTALLGLIAWVVNTGQFYVEGPSVSLLEELAASKGLISRSQAVSGYDLLGLLPLDPLFLSALAQAVLVVLAIAGLWLSLSKVWANPVSPTLTMGLAFFGGSTLWFVTETPGMAVAALFKAVAVAAIVAGKVPILCGAVLVLGYLEPPLGVALFLITIYLAVKRTESYGLSLVACSLLGTGGLLVAMTGDYSLSPSLGGLSGWTLWPILGLCLIAELRAARWELYVVMLLASALTGSPELASIVCLGDLSLLALRAPSKGAEPKQAIQGLRLSMTGLTQGIALLVFVLAILPGEQYLNRRILIPAQKKKVGIGRLFLPFSLSTHVSRLSLDPWRQATPFPNMSQAEVSLLEDLDQPFRVLTIGQPTEDRAIGLLYALTAEQKLLGWDTPNHLSSSSLICKSVAENVIVNSEKILFRGGDSQPKLESGPKSADNAQPADIFRAWAVPLQEQQLSSESGSGYQLISLNKQETLFFRNTPATVVFSARPNVYTLLSLHDPPKKRELKVNKIKLSLRAPDLSEVLASRTFVSLTFQLANAGETAITSRELVGLTLGVEGDPSYREFQQPFPKNFVLFPGESITLPLQFATPTQEGRFKLRASFQSIDGLEHPLPFEESAEIRTWRRLAPVGTWVEEPPTP